MIQLRPIAVEPTGPTFGWLQKLHEIYQPAAFKIAKGAVVRRGLCNACYRAFARYKKARKVTQSDLIREGKLLPISKGGRKPANSFTKELANR